MESPKVDFDCKFGNLRLIRRSKFTEKFLNLIIINVLQEMIKSNLMMRLKRFLVKIRVQRLQMRSAQKLCLF